MKKLLTSGLLFLFLAGPAGAQAVKESLKDVPYDEVLKMATENNDPKAQYDLGVRYFQGEGVEKDPLKADNGMKRQLHKAILELNLI